MKKIILAISLIAGFSVKAQTVEEIISKNLDALGGKDALAKTTSYIAETNTAVMGNDAPGKLYILSGKGYKSVVEIMGSSATQCVTNTAGWTTNPMSGGTAEDMTEPQRASMTATMFIGGLLEGYPANGATVVFEGKEKIESGEAYKLSITAKGGTTATHFIDVNTNLLVLTISKGDMGGNETEIKSSFSDYKKLSTGAVIPHKIGLDLGQFQLETTITKVETNVAIDEATFKKPN